MTDVGGLRAWMPGALGSLSRGRPVLMAMGVGLLLVMVILEVGEVFDLPVYAPVRCYALSNGSMTGGVVSSQLRRRISMQYRRFGRTVEDVGKESGCANAIP